MKVGDYVRFYDRSWTEIGQIVGEVEDSHLKVVKCRDGYYDLDNFIKYGSIIDVIEVGDYVNGCKIIELSTNIDGKVLYLETDITEFDNVYACDHINIYKNDIRTIVTHEQFSQMEYRIGE